MAADAGRIAGNPSLAATGATHARKTDRRRRLNLVIAARATNLGDRFHPTILF
jgi:hypothetical protein